MHDGRFLSVYLPQPGGRRDLWVCVLVGGFKWDSLATKHPVVLKIFAIHRQYLDIIKVLGTDNQGSARYPSNAWS
jgi:hypothetical protein